MLNEASVVFIGLGGAASIFGWFAPIHEFGHILAAVLQGGGGRFNGWQHAQLWGVWDNLVWFVDIGGFALEQAVFYAVAVIAIRKRHYYLASFAIAHYLVTATIAPVVSSDFDYLHSAWLVAFWAASAYGLVRIGIKLAHMFSLEKQARHTQLTHAT